MMPDSIQTGDKKSIKRPTSSVRKTSPSRASVWQMFDRIAHRYDLLNRILSLRRDVVWREKLAGFLQEQGDQNVLDLATGTADVLLSLFRKGNNIASAVGIDMSPKMLQLGQRKVVAHGLVDKIFFVRADAERLPFSESSFDAVTIAFGIRNMANVTMTLAEMHRVLKPGGKALILEFSMPQNWFVRRLYPFHLRGILPRLGAMISGDSYAYRYLNETVETFPYGEQFCDLMQQTGFTEIQVAPLTFGIATIYHGSKFAK